MSYEIIYDVMGVRDPRNPDKVIVFFISGSSNCWEPSPDGGERRERAFSDNYLFPKEYAYKPMGKGELVSYLQDKVIKSWKRANNNREEDISLDDYKENLGWHWGIYIKGTKSNFKSFCSLLRRAVDQSLTPDELREYGCTLKAYFKKGDDEESVTVTNENFSEVLRRIVGDETFRYCTTWGLSDEDDMRRLKKEAGLLRRRRRTSAGKDYVIEFYKKEDGKSRYYGYFHRKLKYGVRYSYSVPKYYTKDNARRTAEKLNREYGVLGWEFKVFSRKEIETKEHEIERRAKNVSEKFPHLLGRKIRIYGNDNRPKTVVIKGIFKDPDFKKEGYFVFLLEDEEGKKTTIVKTAEYIEKEIKKLRGGGGDGRNQNFRLALS